MIRVNNDEFKANAVTEDLLDRIVFGMAINDIPSISTDMTEMFGFELSINLDMPNILDDAKSQHINKDFTDSIGLMLFNLAKELHELNPTNKKKKISFEVAFAEEQSPFGFNLINQRTIH